jgi:hypothetical protein
MAACAESPAPAPVPKEDNKRWDSGNNLAGLCNPLARLRDETGRSAESIQQITQGMRRLYSLPVFATLKIDGSNLSIRVRCTSGAEWEIVYLFGRNSPVWVPADGIAKLNTISYGNAKGLGKLPSLMFTYAVELAKKLGCADLTLFGEAYKGAVDPKKQTQKFASFHPFGWRIGDAVETQYLTRNNWELLSSVAPVGETPFPCLVNDAPAFHAMLEFLATARDHVIFPPPMMFEGPLHGVVANLQPLLWSAAKNTAPFTSGYLPSLCYHFAEACVRTLEGSVIVFENAPVGFPQFVKFKTGIHEEQPWQVTSKKFGQEDLVSKLASVLEKLFQLPDAERFARTFAGYYLQVDDQAEILNRVDEDLNTTAFMFAQVIELWYASRQTTLRVEEEEKSKTAAAKTGPVDGPTAKLVFELTKVCEHEAAKLVPSSFPAKKERTPLVDAFAKTLTDEIVKHYADASTELPWTLAEITKNSLALARKTIMSL